MLPLALLAIAIVGGFFMYRRSTQPTPLPPAEMTDEHIRQGWRKLGFYCEMDNQKRLWTLTGSRAGLLYFPDLLQGYVNDPANAEDGKHAHYGPYGTLEVKTWPDAGFDANSIRGSLMDLTRLAELVEGKLAFAQPGEPIRIRDEYVPGSPYSLQLDVRVDGFDPSTADGERLGAVQKDTGPKAK